MLNTSYLLFLLIILSSLTITISHETKLPCIFGHQENCRCDGRNARCDYDQPDQFPIFNSTNGSFTVPLDFIIEGDFGYHQTSIKPRSFLDFNYINDLLINNTGVHLDGSKAIDPAAFDGTEIWKIQIIGFDKMLPPPEAIRKLSENNQFNWYVISECEECNLKANTFKGFQWLSLLELSHSKVLEFDDDAFVGLENRLNHVRLINVSLTKFSVAALKSLNHLEVLYLNDNQISDFKGISDLKLLVYLEVSGNDLRTAMDNGDFDNLSPNLEEAYFERGGLVSIPSRMIESIPQIDSLHLSDNQISSISESDLPKGSVLRKLYLNGNPISSIESGFLKNLENLLLFDIGNNLLTSLDLSIFEGSAAVFVYLYSCKYLKTIECSSVDKIPQNLKWIDFSLSAIEKFDKNCDALLSRDIDVYFYDINTIICDSDVHWLAKHTLCSPESFNTRDTTCANIKGKLFADYLKENVPAPCGDK